MSAQDEAQAQELEKKESLFTRTPPPATTIPSKILHADSPFSSFFETQPLFVSQENFSPPENP